jgi:hypothetical protein
MTTEINAQTMYDLAMSLETQNNKTQLNDVLNTISISANRGEFMTSYSKPLHEAVVIELRRKRFVVEYMSDRNENYYSISWLRPGQP